MAHTETLRCNSTYQHSQLNVGILVYCEQTPYDMILIENVVPLQEHTDLQYDVFALQVLYDCLYILGST